EGAHLYSGLAKEITPEEYETRIADGSITDVLARHDVSAGDVFFIPAGRVHAICGGCYIAEIQQTSDITYRIWDYKRLGLDGKPRQLHTELAKEAIDYRVYPDYRSSYEKVRNEEALLVDCPFFTTSLLDADAPFTKELGGSDSFLVLMCTGGEGSLSLEGAEVDGMPVQVRAGETLLIPACAEKLHVNPSGDGIKLLLSCQCSR
ncbi:MAG: mannose-6-phosphate isomerase, partial [Bacteroidales bacterium]|nr:mannose-6-phosphate isomerase [Bacteroidales bacterium]